MSHGGMTEGEWRRGMLRLHHLNDFGKLYVRAEFDPLEPSDFCPAVYGTPAQVAAFLRRLAEDIARLEGEETDGGGDHPGQGRSGRGGDAG